MPPKLLPYKESKPKVLQNNESVPKLLPNHPDSINEGEDMKLIFQVYKIIEITKKFKSEKYGHT